MPKQPEEVLAELMQAIEDARLTIRKLHEEVQESKAVLKNEKDRITKLLVEEVDKQVKELRNDVRNEMLSAVERVINEIRDDWREKLGL